MMQFNRGIRGFFYECNVRLYRLFNRNKNNIIPKKTKKRSGAQDKIFIISMLILPIISWFVFYFFTNLNMILMSFKTPMDSWTLKNFVSVWNNLTAPHSEFFIAVKNTFIYFIVSNLIIMPLCLLLSYFLYKKIAGYKFFRIIFYLPAIIPGLVFVTVFKTIILPWGPLSQLGINIPEVGLLGNPDTATWTIVAYCIWTGLSGNMLLFCGTMSRVPEAVLESARIDGCGAFRELIHFILPLIFPTMSTIIIFSMTGLFTSTGPILIMTGGAHETTTISFWIYINVLKGVESSGIYNVISATGLLFTIIALPIIFLTRKLLGKVESAEY